MVATRSPRKVPELRIVSDGEDNLINDRDDEEEEDFEDDELVSKKHSKQRSGRPTRRSPRARASYSSGKPKRRPRAASLKNPKYSK